MREFDDLTLGRVVRFDARPDRMYGFIQELDPENGEPTGNPDIWFHYNDGQFVRPWHSDREVTWDGSIQGNMRLRLPSRDDYVVFADPVPGRDGRLKAEPWTFMSDFYLSCVAISTQSYRIVYGDIRAEHLTIVWEGSVGTYDTRPSGVGALPKVLDSNFTIQCWSPEDAYDNSDGTSGPIPGFWETAENQEEEWRDLVGASKRPRENSFLPPALRRKVPA